MPSFKRLLIATVATALSIFTSACVYKRTTTDADGVTNEKYVVEGPVKLIENNVEYE